MKFSMKGNKGFSLVELMIVVGIIGILASLAVPRLTVFMAKAKQAEARTNLSAIATLMESYRIEQANNAYTGATLGAIGYTTPANVRYAYTLPTITATTFVAQASAALGALCTNSPVNTGTINEARTLTLPVATCP